MNRKDIGLIFDGGCCVISVELVLCDNHTDNFNETEYFEGLDSALLPLKRGIKKKLGGNDARFIEKR